MEIKYNLNINDYTDFNIHYVENNASIQKKFKTQKIAGSILLLAVAILLYFNLPLTNFFAKLVIPAIFVTLAFVWYLSFDKLVHNRTSSQTKKTIRKLDEVLLAEPINLIFKDQQITIQQKHEDTYQYVDVDRLYITDKHLLFYLKENAIIIPKDKLDTKQISFIEKTFAKKLIS